MPAESTCCQEACCGGPGTSRWGRVFRAGCWTFLLCLVIIIITVPFPRTHTEELVVGDRKVFEVSSSWFSAVHVNADDGERSEVDAFLSTTKPTIDAAITFPLNTIYPDIADGSYYFVRYDLYPGSAVNVEWTFTRYNVDPSFLLISGTKAFEKFKSGDDVSWSSIVFQRSSARGAYKFVAKQRSEYYFIFYGESPRVSAAGTVTFDVSSVTLRVPQNSKACKLSNSDDGCFFELSPGTSTNYLIVSRPVETDHRNSPLAKISFSTKGISAAYWNLWFWVLIITLGSAIFVGGFCGCLFGRNVRSRGYVPIPQATHQPNEPLGPTNPAWRPTSAAPESLQPTAPPPPVIDAGAPPAYSPFATNV
ncbi:hypothetical protein DFJ73DRAFT_831627 [Zopfochytrium polystomum]|nr:hypothetical protein DFJ73DRAFT_831627 [Zopfochytrium polystomum]